VYVHTYIHNDNKLTYNIKFLFLLSKCDFKFDITLLSLLKVYFFLKTSKNILIYFNLFLVIQFATLYK